MRTFVAVGGDLTFVIDETLERRWGHRITKRGHYRDPLASSKQRSIATSGTAVWYPIGQPVLPIRWVLVR